MTERPKSAMNVSEQLSAVQRTVGTRVLEAGEAKVVTISRVYPTDPADLWEACTTPDRLARWFGKVSGELKVGGHYQIEGNAGGTVERCEPPRSFAATWEFGGEVSWVEVRFSPEAAGTRVEVQHIAHVDDERWDMFGPGAVGVGWDLWFLGLGLHLESGGAVAQADDPIAWMGSEEGRAFTSGASKAWGEASAAAGTPAEAAGAAAARTTEFYTPPAE